MSTLEKGEDAVRSLPPQELYAFHDWFAQFDAETWSRQLERDVAAGHLDRVADEALEELRQGRCTEL